MAKKPATVIGGHIEIERPDPFYPATDREIVRELEALKKAARRHLDAGNILIVLKHEHACEFCGAQWTEDSPAYNGGCCEKDEASSPDLAPTEASAALATDAPDMAAAVKSLDSLVEQMQEAVRAYLPPDGTSKDELISRLIYLLDGPEQRNAQGLVKAAIAAVEDDTLARQKAA